MTLMAQLERRRLDLEQVRSNAAGVARAVFAFRSSGHGELKLAAPVRFGVTFTEQPAISTGVVLVSGRLVAGKFPNACAGVYQWVRNPRGLFVGAKMFFVVDAGGQSYSLEHHVTFEGVAIKLMPDALNQRDTPTVPRYVPPGWDS